MEHAVRAFGTALGAVFKPTDEWQFMLDEAKKRIDPMSVGTSADVKKKDGLRQAQEDLGRVKLAWRLPGMHSRGAWTTAQARSIYGACHAYMEHTAGLI